MKKLTKLALALTLATASLASSAHAADTISENKVSGVTVVDWGFYFALQGSPALCTSGHTVVQVGGAFQQDLALTTVMAAFLAGREVKVVAAPKDGGGGCVLKSVSIK
jgi:hypothetical protein